MSTTPPRPTPETDAEVGYFDLETAVSADFARKLERERDEMREELQQWKMLCAWGGTPEHIDQFIKGQQSRIHQAQDIEETCEQLERERDEAREWQNVKVTKNGETHCLGTLIDLLERERDEALAKLSTVYRWIERNHSDGFIDSQSHLQNLDRVADAWHDKLEDMQRELGKTRDQLEAMREAIKKGYDALTGCVDDSGELLAERGWWRDEPRCGYQARYEETKQRIEDAEAALTKLKLFIL